MAIAKSKRVARNTQPGSLRVRVVRPMSPDGRPIATRDVRRLLRAVLEHRPYAATDSDQEVASWRQIQLAVGIDSTGAAVDAKQRFWYLIHVYKRHRLYGYALAGLNSTAIQMLETANLCVDTNISRRCAVQATAGAARERGVEVPTELTVPESSSEETSEDEVASIAVTSPTAIDTKTAPPRQLPPATPTDVVERAFSWLSDLNTLLVRTQSERDEKERQLAHEANANQRLRHENQQLRRHLRSLQTELAEVATRTQCLQSQIDGLLGGTFEP